MSAPAELPRGLGDLPRSPEGHFRLLLTAAVFGILDHLRRAAGLHGGDLEEVFAEFPLLREHFLSVRAHLPEDLSWGEAPRWWRSAVERWEAAADPRTLPLRELGRITGLGYEAERTTVLVACVEEDLRMGALMAQLQDSAESRRPCVSLLECLADPEGGTGPTVVSEMLRSGWLRETRTDLPRAERPVRLPVGLWDVVRGRPPHVPGGRIRQAKEAPALESLVLPDRIRARALNLPRLLASGEVRSLVVRGPRGSGRRTLVRSVAGALGMGTIALPAPGKPGVGASGGGMSALRNEIGPACRLGRVLPLEKLEPAPGEAVELPRIPGYDGPLAVILGRQGGVRGVGTKGALHLELPAPGPRERSEFWVRGFGDAEGPPAKELGERFRLTGGYIEEAASLARRYALAEDREAIREDDVRRACHALNRHALETLACRVEPTGGWSDLFVNPVTRADLLDLEDRCRYRESLPRAAGEALRRTLNRGVRALFTGPTGTGKTLGARILASELGMDLYRVDLSSVVDKYVGETEKNLNEILSRAEELDVVLLLDEGDALLTGRTDVRSSNDRYANLETNFLLQRLEGYEGIIVVTTNAGNRIDAAFERRFDVVVDFPPPGPEERLGIWRSHLPAEHEVPAPTVRKVASRASLTGGQIRNAALHASLLSVARGRPGRVREAELEEALQREYRKSGASAPAVFGSGNGDRAEVLRQTDRLIEKLD